MEKNLAKNIQGQNVSQENNFTNINPLKRLAKPNEISPAVIFLASDASSWITGTLIPMDGGNLAQNAGGSHGSEIFNE